MILTLQFSALGLRLVREEQKLPESLLKHTEDELAQWKETKQAASEALIREGGTITHHHAVGRDHMPWYGVQRPTLMGQALAAVKAQFDPNGMLNPGVIVPHR